MVKKKAKKSRKKTGKISSKSKSWEEIGKVVGKKVGREMKGKKCSPWERWHPKHDENGGFFGRLLFIIGILAVLSKLGYLDGISVWLKILIGAGFSLMRF
jgi:hypothetical protein